MAVVLAFAVGAGTAWLLSGGLRPPGGSGEQARERCRDAVGQRVAEESTGPTGSRFEDGYVVGAGDTSTPAAMVSGTVTVTGADGDVAAEYSYSCRLSGYRDGSWGALLWHAARMPDRAG
ncbi:hypothetical protein CS0771_57020 [Catellatospora sp. IY07-71]|uniref:hypothetical protein n=1 Tax=Catellatospora sp. IY07-71 TaxID=2728827 RepID=UPI001BB41765|nr:hypothetical protein [Catellatospora sp. IY07-71]BCJ76158.1 hypothetical protein CS0771_57020 [Catellatospora sp. IY07-71]